MTKWAGHHPAVRAALAAYRYAQAVEQADRAGRLRGKALDAVEAAIDAGDTAAALAVLRAVPATEPTRPLAPAAYLDAEIRSLAFSLPPPPPIRDANGRIDHIAALGLDDRETDTERAARIAVERLAADAGMTEA